MQLLLQVAYLDLNLSYWPKRNIKGDFEQNTSNWIHNLVVDMKEKAY